MAGNAREVQRQAESQGSARGAKAPEPTPGLDTVRALAGPAAANPAAIARVLRQYPMERDEILTWLHQHRGNAFVQSVTAQLGQVERSLPEGVDVESVSGSFTIPAGLELTGNWQASVSTRNPTHVSVEVTKTGVHVRPSPGLFVDAFWPLQNASIRSAGVQFGRGRAYANVTDQSGLGEGFISITDRVEEKITTMLDQAIAGTPLARPGYVPTEDADLGGTLQRVMSGFSNMFKSGGSNQGGKGVTARQMSSVGLGATLTTAGGDFTKNGTGLQVEAGAPISLSASGTANVQDLVDAGTPASAAETANIQSISISSGGLTVMSKGKPIASIEHLTVHRGGRVTIDRMQLLGEAANAQRTEAGLSLLIGLLAGQAGSGEAMAGALNNANNPQIVGGVSRAMMEREFTSTVQTMVLQYRGAVPGIDLATVLGIG